MLPAGQGPHGCCACATCLTPSVELAAHLAHHVPSSTGHRGRASAQGGCRAGARVTLAVAHLAHTFEG
jgi:hypothetical protein